jgi:predicted Fe-S protein YdhL (DUF1289 family)
MSTSPGNDPAASPCIGTCRLEPGGNVCQGCLRTRDEIAAWTSLDTKGRLAILRRLPARRAAR